MARVNNPPAVSQYMPGQTLSVAGCYYSYPPKGEIPFPGTTWRIGQEVKTPPFHGDNRGSIPLGVTTFFFWMVLQGPLAQWSEQAAHNRSVRGSKP